MSVQRRQVFREFLARGCQPLVVPPVVTRRTLWPPSAYRLHLSRRCFICNVPTVCAHRERELVLWELGMEALRG